MVYLKKRALFPTKSMNLAKITKGATPENFHVTVAIVPRLRCNHSITRWSSTSWEHGASRKTPSNFSLVITLLFIKWLLSRTPVSTSDAPPTFPALTS